MNKQKIAILTDSCADVPQELAARSGIYVLPLRIRFSDGEYWDGVDITPGEVYARLPQELPKTSLPSGERVESLFERIRADGYERVLAIIFSSGISGTFNMVRVMGEAYEGLEVAAFDTLSGSLGTGATALQAARWIEEGRTWEELQRAIPRLIAGTRVYFAVDTLEYLQKGGRIGKISAVAGTLLQIKPIITFAEDGQLTSAAKVRGRRQSIARLPELIAAGVPEGASYNLMVAHGDAPEELAALRESIRARLPAAAHFWQGEIDCTLGAYVGPHLLGAGIQLLPEDPFAE